MKNAKLFIKKRRLNAVIFQLKHRQMIQDCDLFFIPILKIYQFYDMIF